MVNATITDRDLCAARALLRWTQRDLAEKAKVPVVYIRRFERGEAMKEEHLQDVVLALNKAGVVFFGKASIAGGKVASGVALTASAKPRAQFEKRVYPPRAVKSAKAVATVPVVRKAKAGSKPRTAGAGKKSSSRRETGAGRKEPP